MCVEPAMNSFYARGDFYRQLKPFAKSLNPRSGPTEWVCTGSNLFDTLIAFLKEFFVKLFFLKKSANDNKCIKKYPQMHTKS